MNRLLAEADAHPDDPGCLGALDFVAMRTRGWRTDEANRALRLLIRDHTRREGISQATRAAFALEDRPEADQLCRLVLLENPSRADRGRACEDLAYSLLFHAGRVRPVREGRRTPDSLPPALRNADADALQAEAAALYERCVAEFADVPVVGYGAGETVGRFAQGALNDLRLIRVSQPAPEITGNNVDGRPLRLGDYRGRVVVLVFAGEWCGPCRAQAATYRELLQLEAQAKNPCVLLEVNTDETREPLRRAIAAGEVAWPCWFDGGVTGPITMAWGNTSFPM